MGKLPGIERVIMINYNSSLVEVPRQIEVAVITSNTLWNDLIRIKDILYVKCNSKSVQAIKKQLAGIAASESEGIAA